jgi:hypothetical protein
MAEDLYSHINLRLPRWMHEELRQLAQNEDRSVNGQILHAIREHLNKRRRRAR